MIRVVECARVTCNRRIEIDVPEGWSFDGFCPECTTGWRSYYGSLIYRCRYRGCKRTILARNFKRGVKGGWTTFISPGSTDPRATYTFCPTHFRRLPQPCTAGDLWDATGEHRRNDERVLRELLGEVDDDPHHGWLG